MPLYHTAASMVGVASALGLGSSVAIGRRFSTQTFWKDVRDSQATIIHYVGEACRYLLAAPPDIDPTSGENLDQRHKVRIALGNGLRPDVWDRFKRRFNIETITEFYGQTEGVRIFWNRSNNDFGSGAVGRNGYLTRILGRSLITLVDLDWETETPWRDPKTGFCRKTKLNEPGELLCKLDEKNIKKSYYGYYKNDAANEKKVLRDVFIKGDAWYRSGDVLRRDSEGRWYFHDRIGDTYRWKSENISTSVSPLAASVPLSPFSFLHLTPAPLFPKGNLRPSGSPPVDPRSQRVRCKRAASRRARRNGLHRALPSIHSNTPNHVLHSNTSHLPASPVRHPAVHPCDEADADHGHEQTPEEGIDSAGC